MTSPSNTKYYFVYVLLSLKDQKFYVGYTENIENRFNEHISGHVISTRNRRPLILIHFEAYIDKGDALAREVFLKSGFGREQLRKSLGKTLIKYLHKFSC